MGVEEFLVADDRTSIVVILPQTRISHIRIFPGDALKISAGPNDDHHLYFLTRRQTHEGIEASAAGYHPTNTQFTPDLYSSLRGMRTLRTIPTGRIEKI